MASSSNRPRSRRSLRRLRLIIFLAAALGLTGVVVAAYAANVVDGAELDTVDQRFEIRGSNGAPADVVVVGIDDVTFGELQQRWPFPRRVHARAVDRLSEAGAKVIAYDIQFTEPTTPRDDNALITAVDRADGVVLATTEVDRKGRANVFGGEEVLRAIGARAGNSNLMNDEDGAIRRMPYEVEGLTSFSIAATRGVPRRARSRPHRLGVDRLRGRSRNRGLPLVLAPPLRRVRRRPVRRQDRRGRARRRRRFRTRTPRRSAEGAQMSGPEVQANAMATALAGFPLEEAPHALNIGLIVLLGLVGPVHGACVRPAARGDLRRAGRRGLRRGGSARVQQRADRLVPLSARRRCCSAWPARSRSGSS